MTAKDNNTLHVWYENHLVGRLWRDEAGIMGFRYDDRWIHDRGFFVSWSMPLATGTFEPSGGIAHRFFANLLPEAWARERIVRERMIPDTDFDLLHAIGGECAGAISVLPPGEAPSTNRNYRSLTEQDMNLLVSTKGHHLPETESEYELVRLSLAGAQDKIAVLIRNDDVSLPLGEAPSSHILKFESPRFKNLAGYEVFTMWLAHAVGLPVAEISLQERSRERFIQTRRYDRIEEENGEIRRLHQEDFCQALGVGHTHKYQEFHGPSFPECFHLVQTVSTEPALDSRDLLRWQIFNVLAGNSDGHAKNLSFLYDMNGSIRLAPFYDLVCTRAIQGIDQRLALWVGSERFPGAVNSNRWGELASACGVRRPFLMQWVDEMATALQEHIAPVREEFENTYGAFPALQRIEKVVMKQCKGVAG